MALLWIAAHTGSGIFAVKAGKFKPSVLVQAGIGELCRKAGWFVFSAHSSPLVSCQAEISRLGICSCCIQVYGIGGLLAGQGVNRITATKLGCFLHFSVHTVYR